MTHLLVRPKYLSFRNRWRRQSPTRRRIHDTLIASFALLVGTAVYFGTLWAWREILQMPFLAFITPALPLSLLFMLLMFMTALSAVASSLGTFYLADDLELLLSSPLRPRAFFFGRSALVLISVIWMPFIFTFPVLLAFGEVHASILPTLGHALLSLTPFFIIPVMIAIAVASLITAGIDPRWNRAFLVVGALVALVGLVFVGQTLGTTLRMRNDPNQILSLVAKLQRANLPWSPSTWVSTILSESLVSTGKRLAPRYLALYSAAACSTALAYIAILLFHGRGYTRARNAAQGVRRGTIGRRLHRLLPPNPAFAIMTKEFHSLLRDVSQTSQLIFLIGVCFIYISHIGGFVSIDAFPSEARPLWQVLLLVVHAAATSFFITSVCARFVFTSISAEGRNFWALQTSPLPMRKLLHAKLLVWYPPIACVGITLFGIGAVVIADNLALTVAFIGIGTLLTFALVAVGIGIGGAWADFSWEHPSQLAAGLNTFAYMVGCIFLIGLHLPAIGYLSFLILRLQIAPQTHLWWQLGFLGTIVAGCDVALGLWALRVGIRRLEAGESFF